MMAMPEPIRIENVNQIPKGKVFQGFWDKDEESALKYGLALFSRRYGYEPKSVYVCPRDTGQTAVYMETNKEVLG
jgi:hypothetical protein